MKKTLISIVAIAFAALMITNVYAITIPPPTFDPCKCYSPGFTPGFWKHNIEVRLGLTNGAYSAFEGGWLDGMKLTDALMDWGLAEIQKSLGSGFTFEKALEYLQLKGWDPLRTNTANWFNFVAGYGPF